MGFEKPPAGTVYTSDRGSLCTRCGHPAEACRCAAEPPSPEGPLRVSRETKGRQGKCVTVVTGLGLPAADLTALARRLKRVCGSGGTVKDGVIEIQGDHRDRVVAELARAGHTARRAGG